MKRFSKILAVVLVISLIASLFAVTVSAVNMDKASFQIAFKDKNGNPISSAKSGEIVDLYVSMKTYDDSYAENFQMVLAIDKTALAQTRNNSTAVQKPSAKNCFELIGMFADDSEVVDENDPIWQYEDENVGNGYYKPWGAGEFIATPNITPPEWTDEEKANCIGLNFSYTSDSSDSVLLINTKGQFVEIVRFRFIAQKDTVLDETIMHATKAFISIAPEEGVWLANTQTVNAKKAKETTVEFAKVAAAKVYHVANQVQKNSVDGLVNIGVKGGFKSSDIAIAFNDAGTSTNVKNVGATVTINGVAQTGSERFVYDVNGDGSEYQFRAVINGVDPSNATDIKVVLYVEMTDGTVYNANEVTVTASEIDTLAAKVL